MNFGKCNRIICILIVITIIMGCFFHASFVPFNYILEIILLLGTFIYLIICALNQDREIAKFGLLFSFVYMIILIILMFI